MRFPEPVHYARTDSPGWPIRDWDTANKLLGYLGPERHFAVFTLPDAGYVQCLGGKRALTVELRQAGANGAFVHWVLGRGALVGREVRVGTTTEFVTVDESQVLAMRDARKIIRLFLETGLIHDGYTRTDVTSRFR